MEFVDNNCYVCGIEMPESGIIGAKSGRQYCSDDCFDKAGTAEYKEPTEELDDLTVPVKGKCNGKVIKGTATFSIHGDVHLEFDEPQLKATMTVPKAFLKFVSVMYDNEESSE